VFDDVLVPWTGCSCTHGRTGNSSTVETNCVSTPLTRQRAWAGENAIHHRLADELAQSVEDDASARAAELVSSRVHRDLSRAGAGRGDRYETCRRAFHCAVGSVRCRHCGSLVELVCPRRLSLADPRRPEAFDDAVRETSAARSAGTSPATSKREGMDATPRHQACRVPTKVWRVVVCTDGLSRARQCISPTQTLVRYGYDNSWRIAIHAFLRLGSSGDVPPIVLRSLRRRHHQKPPGAEGLQDLSRLGYSSTCIRMSAADRTHSAGIADDEARNRSPRPAPRRDRSRWTGRAHELLLHVQEASISPTVRASSPPGDECIFNQPPPCLVSVC